MADARGQSTEPWTALCRTADLPAAGGHYMVIDGKALAIFPAPESSEGETVRVLDDTCPHAGASLSGGHLSADGCVVCPWHGWTFDAQSGRCPDNPAIAVRSYEARIENGHVLVKLDPL